MKYSEKIKLLSDSIFNFSQETSTDLEMEISNETIHRIAVYRKNLFFGVYGHLDSEFIGLKAHMGHENFKFVVRKYLIEKRVTSPNISDLSKSFPVYLESIFSFHQDPLLEPLAKVDLLCNYAEQGHLKCFSGLFKYWSSLVTEQNSQCIEIDTDSFETIEVFEKEGERALKLRHT